MIPVLILAGGKGTRLGPIAADIPKPMVPVLGKPLLEWQFDLAVKHGAPSTTVYAGHKAGVIADRYDGAQWQGMGIRVVVESTPLGTAGAVLADFENLPEEFFVLYGDTMTNVDLTRMLAHHRQAETDATLYVHPNDHPHDSDLVEVDGAGLVKEVHGYPHPDGVWHRNLVNAALYIFKRKALAAWAGKERRCDFAKHLIPEMLTSGCRIAAYRGYDYIKDMGTPDRLASVEKDVQQGVFDLKRSANPRAAVFLDRDGTMIQEKNHLSDPEEVSLIAGVPQAIRRLNRAAMPVLVVTNQPVIARGEATRETVQTIHARIDALLGGGGAFVDEWFYCPHHPDRGYAGEVPELKISCDCRKPGTGMIDKAVRSAPVLLENSWLIGDTSTDMETARRAGLRSVLVRTGYAGCDGKHAVKPDYVFPDLARAVDFIIDGYPGLRALADTVASTHRWANLVVIGGKAHSGKSSFASALREAYQRTGRSCDSICLDGFILGPRDRGDTFESRHDLAAAGNLVEKIISRRGDVLPLKVPSYDRRSRGPFPVMEDMDIHPESVVIIEGVSASALPFPAHPETPFLWVACEEEKRKSRFTADYQWRGLSPEEILELWTSRQVEENLHAPDGAEWIHL